MKRYTLEVTLEEGSDEWWEEISGGDRTGIDDVVEWIRTLFAENQIDATVTFKKYES
jgi:hypothetical protein